MPQTIQKLRPDRDLQCYFERPSAIAALSETSESGYTVSGTWRQQFDWAVVEWNRDNVIEHPAFRNLPDGDLSGLQLTYEETRSNCIPMDSDLFPTVDWPYLRVWASKDGAEQFYRVSLKGHATPIEGAYVPAAAELSLAGSVTAGDYAGISFLDRHFTYQLLAGDTLESAAQAIVDAVNATPNALVASRAGSTVRLVYTGEGQSLATSTTGANGNRLGVYGFVSGAGTEAWSPQSTKFSGGQSPTKWRVSLDFGSLVDIEGRTVPTTQVRKLRWTYAAELQSGAYQRSEFSATTSNWTVTGAGRDYSIACAASRRIEDDSKEFQYSGVWTEAKGNFSGGGIRYATAQNASVRCTFTCSAPQRLYVGTRYAFNAATISAQVDGQAAQAFNLLIAGEDVLARLDLGTVTAGTHTVTLKHTGPAGYYFYFDFLEMVTATTNIPDFEPLDDVTLATDWDTDHSLAIPPERTAWLIHTLGFRARQNHYVGALWFYELVRDGHVYASTTVDFTGTPVFSQTTQILIGRVGETSQLTISHLNRIGDTAQTIAKAFELELNRGYTGIRAEAVDSRLTIYARAMGTLGNVITVSASPAAGPFQVTVGSPTLSGGVDGEWHTDLQATPRVNRACRDWSRAFYKALKAYGIEVTAAFSMELQHGDGSVEAGIAQRYPNGDPAMLNTPALQTNFSPTSTDFWKEVYKDMAQVMQEAEVPPYLQFGEVQWWYFPAGSGMPLYDAYTLSQFEARYGRPMAVITANNVNPTQYTAEVEFLPTLIGEFTKNVMAWVRTSIPECQFEVLYPTDVNDTAFNRLINYPAEAWTPENLDCLKTESFSYTFARNVDQARTTVEFPGSRGFPISKRSFLVGINDPTTAWKREVELAQGKGHPSIVLFALDQFCLVGYPLPISAGTQRSVQQG